MEPQRTEPSALRKSTQDKSTEPVRKPYTRPAIIAEFPLETRAGSPLSQPMDPNGLPNDYGL